MQNAVSLEFFKLRAETFLSDFFDLLYPLCTTLLIYAYGLRLPFGLHDFWLTYPPYTPYIKFLFVRLRFRYPFFSPSLRGGQAWESLWGSSATTPLEDFPHTLTACPSYQKRSASKETLLKMVLCQFVG